MGRNDVYHSESGDMLTARLVVGADGANSRLRNKADIPLTFWDYRHHALVATIQPKEPHGGVARQIFHNDGSPGLPCRCRSASLLRIVWSQEPERKRSRCRRRRRMPSVRRYAAF